MNMATITVRNIDDAVYNRLKRDAKLNHRSLEAEVRARLDIDGVQASSGRSMADEFRALLMDPGPGYEGSVVLIRSIRDDG